MKKLLIFFSLALSLLLFAGYSYISSAPYPSQSAEIAIAKSLAIGYTPIEEGNTGYALHDGVRIWYEYIAPRTDSVKATVLLIMGHSTTGINWSDYFYGHFLDSGYSVIIYDNRGVGRSDWIEDWTQETAYTLEDMAGDGIAILDHLNIERAHIVGISMGGMIAQRIAISYPDRLWSLGSIMSSGYMMDPDLPKVDDKFESNLTKLGIRYFMHPGEANAMRFAMVVADELKGDGDYTPDYDRIANRTLYELRERKRFNAQVGEQHTMAIVKSGSRYDELAKINVPTVVIHGLSDPLVNPAHARKYAPMIKNAKLVWIEGMGHDIPQIYAEQLSKTLIENMDISIGNINLR